MSEKKFEVTYSDEAKKVIEPIGEGHEFTPMGFFRCSAIGCAHSDVSKFAITMARKIDAEIHKHIIDVAKEQGCSSLFILDKHAIAEKLKRLEPAQIVKEESKVSSCVHYYCPTCGARIGKYPFCKYCGQALIGVDEA